MRDEEKGKHDILMHQWPIRVLYFKHDCCKRQPLSDLWCLKCKHVSVQPVEATDDAFWDQFWADTSTTVQDVFALVPAAEIRAVREESPSNLATLCYKVRCSSPSRPHTP